MPFKFYDNPLGFQTMSRCVNQPIYTFNITGRTHRSNQLHCPEYIVPISELAGERRFATAVAKRLASLVSCLKIC